MPVNILVADDSVTMRRIMEVTFAGEDAQVTAVTSGEACVEKARELSPDVVFADASMNDMDGYSVANAIKTATGLERTAVIVMASQKVPYDEAKGKAAGVDDHILKPFDTQHVIDRVNQVLSRPRMRAAAAASVPQPVPPPPPPGVRTTAASPPSLKSPGMAPPPPQASGAIRSTGAAAVAARHDPAPLATANGASLQSRLEALGLDAQQVDGVLALSREVIEQVVWEVVPELAETLIKEEIRRLTAD